MRAQVFRAPSLRSAGRKYGTRAPATAQAEPDTKAEDSKPKKKEPGPLEKGGTLKGAKAAGKDAGAAAKAATAETSEASYTLAVVDGYFKDDRWVDGTWDFAQFPGKDGETDWDAVIDAEMARRKMLEDQPLPSRLDSPVNFDTGMIPWWAWVKRFHLPEAEKLNGRAAMVGYLLAGIVDLTSGAGLVEQQESFLGKILLHIVVFAVLLFRSGEDVEKYKNLIDEATFYDKQWNASWENQVRPSEQEK